ncbi:1261_t:CDS:2 [Entrophospora sp. SA101]|nr:1261_t:CDS:2 [Entrophospora sp. SA101]
MEPLYLYHLKSRTLADVDWYKLFKNWSLQSSNIIEIRSELSCIYPSDYIFNDREYCAWCSLIKAAETCNNAQQFAKSISDAIDANKKGLEGKRRILSIVADNFTLEELRKSNVNF